MLGRLHLAIYLVSVATIAFQLALMQLLSIAQWHHFASMTISVALLGFGTSGTVIALGRSWLLPRVEQLLPMLLFGCALLMPSTLLLAQRLFGGFDAYLLVIDQRQFWHLLLIQLLFLLPFLCGALAIGLVFVTRVESIGGFYFANLLGSACGGILLLGSMWLLTPARLPAYCAVFAWLAGALLIKRNNKTTWATMTASAIVIAAQLLWPTSLQVSQYKGVRQALALPDAHISLERSSPYGLLQVVSAPALRPAPDLSLGFHGTVPVQDVVYINGEQLGPMPGKQLYAAARLLDFSPSALSYAMAPRSHVLVLQAGTGLRVAHAIARGAQSVVAVEANRAAPRPVAQPSAKADMHWLGLEPRAMLAANQLSFDLITMPEVGSFGGNAGLGAMAQQYLLTTEAMAAMWHSLNPEGVLQVSAWLDSPPRNALRLAQTLVSMLRAEGIQQPAEHLIAIRNWGSVLFILKRSPVTATDIDSVRRFCDALQFDLTLLPGLEPEERSRYHALESAELLQNLDKIVSGESSELLADYPFRLQAPDDDHPYFSQFLQWRSLPRLDGLVHQRSLPLLELGYVVEWVTFLQIALFALLLILLPLGTLRSRGRLGTLAYFGSLGLGYMLFEIALLHQLVFYFGQPIFAAAGAITGLLLFSGLGSYASGKRGFTALNPWRSTLIIGLLIALASIVLPWVLAHTVALPLVAKLAITLALVAIPGFIMGFPFPSGLRRLALRGKDQLPWALGINACLSVIAVPMATLIAVEAGFSRLLLIAALTYLVACFASRR